MCLQIYGAIYKSIINLWLVISILKLQNYVGYFEYSKLLFKLLDTMIKPALQVAYYINFDIP